MQISSSSSAPSVFVTALAWVLICLTGLGLFTSLMHTVFVNALLPALMHQGAPMYHMPEPLFQFARMMTVVQVVVSGFLVFAAWALLKRRAWARQTFVVVFVLGVLWSAFVFLTMGLGVGVFHVLPPEAARHGVSPDVSAVLRVMATMLGLLAAGVGIVLFWLTRQLSTPVIRAEFSASAA